MCGIGVGRVKHIHSLKILRSRNIYTEHLGILAEKSEGDIDNLLKGTILTFAKEVLCYINTKINTRAIIFLQWDIADFCYSWKSLTVYISPRIILKLKDMVMVYISFNPLNASVALIEKPVLCKSVDWFLYEGNTCI